MVPTLGYLEPQGFVNRAERESRERERAERGREREREREREKKQESGFEGRRDPSRVLEFF